MGELSLLKGEFAIVDVGLKSEGRIDLKEFGSDQPKAGDFVDIYIDRLEDRQGRDSVKSKKALREGSLGQLGNLQKRNQLQAASHSV